MMSVPGTFGCTMDAPADAAYAVLPVGVDIIRPDTRTIRQTQHFCFGKENQDQRNGL